jgi:hypothetical protein
VLRRSARWADRVCRQLARGRLFRSRCASWVRRAAQSGFKRRSVTLEDRFPAATRAEGHAVTMAGGWTEGRLSACSAATVDGVRVLGAAANPPMMQGYALAR